MDNRKSEQPINADDATNGPSKNPGNCTGMQGKCMQELRTLAAAGKLKAWQNRISVFDYDAIFRDDIGDNVGEILAASGSEEQDEDAINYDDIFSGYIDT